MPRRAPSLAGLVFALLVLATLAAFAWSQHLKRAPLVLDKVTFVAVPTLHPKNPVHNRFTPNGDCRYDRIRIRFRTTRGRFLKRYHFHTYYWDGHQRGGGTAPFGRYKLRVKLLSQGRTLVPPGTIRLHRAPSQPLKGCRS